MPLDIIIGAQWGDEGKGRVVDLLSARANIVARYNGGDNAGHTVTTGKQTFKLHLLPSGLIHTHTTGILGNAMVINPATLLSEIETLNQAGLDITPKRLQISYAAHLITPAHIAMDRAQEEASGKDKIGTTLRGIGPAYTTKTARTGLRVEAFSDVEKLYQLLSMQIKETNLQLTQRFHQNPIDPGLIQAQYRSYAERLSPFITDTSMTLHNALSQNANVLAEGAQGTLLDLDHGTYPFVTSSNPCATGALVGLGIGHSWVNQVIGVTKVFQTRVGEGPFPSEVSGDLAACLRGSGANPWDEYGTTTGRPRRVGWLDLVLLRYAIRINGITELVLTKLDILSAFEQINICYAYRKKGEVVRDLPLGPGALQGFEPVYDTLPGWQTDIVSLRSWHDLPQAACGYVKYIEKQTGIPVSLVSVGPEREQVIENIH